jgi:hypothetical protein
MIRAHLHRAARVFVAGFASSLATAGLAQEVSRDRADFDAAAGRLVFQNVLLADPQAFSSRPRLRREEPRAVVTAPAATGDAAADRYELDAAAGRPVYSSLRGSASAERDQGAGPKQQRTVRVIMPSPYGR